MAILHRVERATAAEVQAELADPPGYSSVRKLLEILEKKGEVQHETDGPRYVFAPSTVKTEARRSAPPGARPNLLQRIRRGDRDRSPRHVQGEDFAGGSQTHCR